MTGDVIIIYKVQSESQLQTEGKGFSTLYTRGIPGQGKVEMLAEFLVKDLQELYFSVCFLCRWWRFTLLMIH